MTFMEVFAAIFSEFLYVEMMPYVVVVLVVPVVAYLHGRERRTTRQRRVVLVSVLLWLAVPVSGIIGAAFRFSAASNLRGDDFNQLGAMLSASILPTVAVASIFLIAVGSGVRANVAGLTLPLLFAQFWVSIIAGCAIVGVCL